MPGQTEPGDGYFVAIRPGGVLVAVVDGLGHGPEAAVAMHTAIATLQANASANVTALMGLCHRSLGGTRGAVMSLASFNTHDGTLTWAGVGDVVGVTFSRAPGSTGMPRFLLRHNGIVGQYLPPLHTPTIPVSPGDTLIFATDGVDQDFIQGVDLDAAPQKIAEQVLAKYALGTDDALVLIVRYLGEAHGP